MQLRLGGLKFSTSVDFVLVLESPRFGPIRSFGFQPSVNVTRLQTQKWNLPTDTVVLLFSGEFNKISFRETLHPESKFLYVLFTI